MNSYRDPRRRSKSKVLKHLSKVAAWSSVISRKYLTLNESKGSCINRDKSFATHYREDATKIAIHHRNTWLCNRVSLANSTDSVSQSDRICSRLQNCRIYAQCYIIKTENYRHSYHNTFRLSFFFILSLLLIYSPSDFSALTPPDDRKPITISTTSKFSRRRSGLRNSDSISFWARESSLTYTKKWHIMIPVLSLSGSVSAPYVELPGQRPLDCKIMSLHYLPLLHTVKNTNPG